MYIQCIWGSYQFADSVDPGQDLFCFPDKHPGEADNASSWTTLWASRSWVTAAHDMQPFPSLQSQLHTHLLFDASYNWWCSTQHQEQTFTALAKVKMFQEKGKKKKPFKFGQTSISNYRAFIKQALRGGLVFKFINCFHSRKIKGCLSLTGT